MSTIAIVIFGVISQRYGIALALGGSTSAGAALVAGATVLPTFYATALGAAAILFFRFFSGRRLPDELRVSRLPGVIFLVVFAVWATLITFLGPLLFDGLPIVTTGASQLLAGVITTSNIAQMSYLALGIATVVLIARSSEAGPGLLGLSLGVAMGLSLWRYLSQSFGLPFPEGILDNSPNFTYIETAAGGVQRFRGIFSEPSSLAGSALVALAYSLSRIVHTRGLRRVCVALLVVISVFIGVVSTSTTFIIAGTLMLGVAIVVFVVSFLRGRERVSPATGLVGIATLSAVILALPLLAQAAVTIVGDKLETESFDERSNSDSDSLAVFVNSWGLGVGLGAGRASSIIPTLLSTTGIIGTAFFAATAAVTIYRSAHLIPYRPAIWGLSAWLVVKVVSGPDLAEPAGILWIALGLLIRGVIEERLHGAAQSEQALLSERKLKRVMGIT